MRFYKFAFAERITATSRLHVFMLSVCLSGRCNCWATEARLQNLMGASVYRRAIHLSFHNSRPAVNFESCCMQQNIMFFTLHQSDTSGAVN